MVTECLGKNQAGGPCGGYVSQGASWCLWHDPAREAEREEWRRRGGANRSNQARAKKRLRSQAMTLADVDALLCQALREVHSGDLEPNVGNALATIARSVATLRQVSDFEARLAALEESAGTSTVQRWGA